MPNVIIYTADVGGGICICNPTGEVPIEIVQAKDIPAGKQSYIVDSATLPEIDFDFFGAWEQTNGVVSVNILKAREIAKTRLRLEREPLLLEQDVLFQRALENGTSTAEIVVEKQRLRDITKMTDAINTTAELRSLKAAI